MAQKKKLRPFTHNSVLRASILRAYERKNYKTVEIHPKQTFIQLFRERWSEHATIPKGNIGYNRYNVSDIVAVEPTFVAFL